MKRYVTAITGASGAVLGLRLVQELLKTSEVHLILSAGALNVMRSETALDFSADIPDSAKKYFDSESLYVHEDNNFYAPVASGSFITDGMFIVPCSMKTLSGIANGYAENLIERAADVTIKEGRRLVVSPREMPLSAIHLENMLKLARIGVTVAPPVPGFYHGSDSLDSMIDFLIGKLLDSMSVPHHLFKRWGQ
ncbi:MAG: flavin prenyltransferase UbiX [Dissulfurispiraceae bacterium]|jgi:4-hydroxy-3-polyprenylbenzoate decarboxylase|nr:flavin prenyltransferase UbiX [Dissulfurispiraceae bacterium]